MTCARYLANFPGGFSEEAANAVVYGLLPTITEVPACLKVLVQASILEKGDQRGHYHFHKLIKEFFLHIQSKTSPEEPADFIWRFRKYYISLLSDLTKAFESDPPKAISRFDSDKLNFRYLFEVVRSSPDIIRDVPALKTIVLSYNLKFLFSRFPYQEIKMLFEDLLKHMDSNLKSASQEMGFVNYFKLYIDLMLTRMKLSEEGQCEILSSRSQMVEWLASHAIGRDASEYYIEYYNALRHCFRDKGLNDEVTKCQDQISKKVEDTWNDFKETTTMPRLEELTFTLDNITGLYTSLKWPRNRKLI